MVVPVIRDLLQLEFIPVIAEILDHTVAVGTQVKIDIPGKGATVAFVDSIETPTVRVKNGDVVKIRDVKHGIEIRKDIEKILHLGDILISFGDFLENNAQLVPTGYVEEFWIEELREKLAKYEPNDEYLTQFLNRVPTLDESLKISLDFQIPLHPQFLYFWDQISSSELSEILQPTKVNECSIEYPMNAKKILEKLGVPHKQKESIILEENEAKIFYNLLFRKAPIIDDSSVPKIISKSSEIPIRNKFSTSIGVRIGRPEKAAARQMKPPTMFYSQLVIKEDQQETF